MPAKATLVLQPENTGRECPAHGTSAGSQTCDSVALLLVPQVRLQQLGGMVSLSIFSSRAYKPHLRLSRGSSKFLRSSIESRDTTRKPQCTQLLPLPIVFRIASVEETPQTAVARQKQTVLSSHSRAQKNQSQVALGRLSSPEWPIWSGPPLHNGNKSMEETKRSQGLQSRVPATELGKGLRFKRQHVKLRRLSDQVTKS